MVETGPVSIRGTDRPRTPGQQAVQRAGKSGLGLAQRDPILRALGAGDTRLDGRQVKFHHRGVDRLLSTRAEQALGLGIRLDERHLPGVPTGQRQVIERQLVDRTDGDRGAILGRHVAQRRAVSQGEGGQPRPEELHELADHAVLTEPLRDR